MTEQLLAPAPKGRLEKLQAANVPGSLLGVLLVVVALRLLEPMGFWPALGIVAVLSIAANAMFDFLLAPTRRRRIALDAKQGLFECAYREPESTFTRKWSYGYAKIQPREIVIQAKTDLSGSVEGPPLIYTDPQIIGEGVNAPWLVYPRRSAVVLATNQGRIELAASSASLKLLTAATLT